MSEDAVVQNIAIIAKCERAPVTFVNFAVYCESYQNFYQTKPVKMHVLGRRHQLYLIGGLCGSVTQCCTLTIGLVPQNEAMQCKCILLGRTKVMLLGMAYFSDSLTIRVVPQTMHIFK